MVVATLALQSRITAYAEYTSNDFVVNHSYGIILPTYPYHFPEVFDFLHSHAALGTDLVPIGLVFSFKHDASQFSRDLVEAKNKYTSLRILPEMSHQSQHPPERCLNNHYLDGRSSSDIVNQGSILMYASYADDIWPDLLRKTAGIKNGPTKYTIQCMKKLAGASWFGFNFYLYLDSEALVISKTSIATIFRKQPAVTTIMIHQGQPAKQNSRILHALRISEDEQRSSFLHNETDMSWFHTTKGNRFFHRSVLFGYLGRLANTSSGNFDGPHVHWRRAAESLGMKFDSNTSSWMRGESGFAELVGAWIYQKVYMPSTINVFYTDTFLRSFNLPHGWKILTDTKVEEVSAVKKFAESDARPLFVINMHRNFTPGVKALLQV